MYAERVDHLEGHDEWRKRPDSLLYNHKVPLFSSSFCAVVGRAHDEQLVPSASDRLSFSWF